MNERRVLFFRTAWAVEILVLDAYGAPMRWEFWEAHRTRVEARGVAKTMRTRDVPARVVKYLPAKRHLAVA